MDRDPVFAEAGSRPCESTLRPSCRPPCPLATCWRPRCCPGLCPQQCRKRAGSRTLTGGLARHPCCAASWALQGGLTSPTSAAPAPQPGPAWAIRAHIFLLCRPPPRPCGLPQCPGCRSYNQVCGHHRQLLRRLRHWYVGRCGRNESFPVSLPPLSFGKRSPRCSHVLAAQMEGTSPAFPTA